MRLARKKREKSPLGAQWNRKRQEKMTITAMTWNWMEGGLSRPNEKGLREPILARREAARALVKRTRPDVLTLNEALGGSDEIGAHIQCFADILGFKHHVYGAYDGLWGNAILSQWPIVEVRRELIHKDGPQNRGLLAAKIAFPDGEAWVATYHPHPRRAAEKRAKDVRQFISELSGPAWLSADFNALEPGDPVDVESLVKVHERFMKPQAARESVERFVVAGELLFDGVFPELGWTPVTPEDRLPTMPTALIRHPGDKGMRIDHIVVGPEIKSARAWVDQAAEADLASDHYPVLARIEIGGAPNPERLQ